MIGDVRIDQNGKVEFTITMDEEYLKELLNELNMVHNNHVLLFGFEHIDNLRIELMGLLEYFNEKRMEGEIEMEKPTHVFKYRIGDEFHHEFCRSLDEAIKKAAIGVKHYQAEPIFIESLYDDPELFEGEVLMKMINKKIVEIFSE